MSRLADLQQRIQDTNVLIEQMERRVSGTPNASGASSHFANIRSLEKRRSMLEREFVHAADRQSKDVCSYQGQPKTGGGRV